MVVGVKDVIVQTNFCFNIFRGFRSTGGQNFHFPINFAGHRNNSAAATVQPVISRKVLYGFSTTCIINATCGKDGRIIFWGQGERSRDTSTFGISQKSLLRTAKLHPNQTPSFTNFPFPLTIRFSSAYQSPSDCEFVL